jgi:aspartate/tyrosine/aromatic aminotransferase
MKAFKLSFQIDQACMNVVVLFANGQIVVLNSVKEACKRIAARIDAIGFEYTPIAGDAHSNHCSTLGLYFDASYGFLLLVMIDAAWRYLGDARYVHAAAELGFGATWWDAVQERTAAMQTLSGTGALRIGFEMIARQCGTNIPVLISNPSWPNHVNIVRVSRAVLCRLLSLLPIHVNMELKDAFSVRRVV